MKQPREEIELIDLDKVESVTSLADILAADRALRNTPQMSWGEVAGRWSVAPGMPGETFSVDLASVPTQELEQATRTTQPTLGYRVVRSGRTAAQITSNNGWWADSESEPNF